MATITVVDAPGYERHLKADLLLTGYPAVDSRGELSVVQLESGEITVVPSSCVTGTVTYFELRKWLIDQWVIWSTHDTRLEADIAARKEADGSFGARLVIVKKEH
jgi:hypothetical protein